MTDTQMPTDISSKHDEPISEKDVLDRWPLLSLEDLRAARKHGRIAWISGKRGSAWYRPSAVQIYITEFKERRCHVREKTPSSSLANNGSAQFLEAPRSTASGMTRELEERVAQASAQRI